MPVKWSSDKLEALLFTAFSIYLFSFSVKRAPNFIIRFINLSDKLWPIDWLLSEEVNQNLEASKSVVAYWAHLRPLGAANEFSVRLAQDLFYKLGVLGAEVELVNILPLPVRKVHYTAHFV